MKMLIIGVSGRSYVDKDTKETHDMLTLSVAKNNVNYHGKATEEFIVNDKSPLYAYILGEIKGEICNLKGYFIDVDKNNKGYLENLELLEKSDDAVIWGF